MDSTDIQSDLWIKDYKQAKFCILINLKLQVEIRGVASNADATKANLESPVEI